MQEYAPVPGDDAFTQARECYEGLEDWLASQDAAGLQHAELEEQVGVGGREVLRLLFQGHLDLLAGREVRRHDGTGEDGVLRTRAEKGREWPLATKFGQVTVSRIAYRAPGAPNVHPLDAALNLAEEKHSHGLRKLAAVEAVRGSHEGAAAAVTRATGVKIGERQAEELVLRAARALGGVCRGRRPGPAPAVAAGPGGGAARAPGRGGGRGAPVGRANTPKSEPAPAGAGSRGATVTIIIAFIHVLESLGQAAWSFFNKGEPAAEEWV